MSNPSIELQRGAIPLTLDRPRILFFDMTGTWLLVQRYGVDFIRKLYTVTILPTADKNNPAVDLALKDVDALAYFLWAGLQAELVDTGATLSQEEARTFIRPWTITPIFNAVVCAVTGATATPALPGKVDAAAAAAKPVAGRKAAAPKVSTSRKRNGSSVAS
jgi:hypothetical protein